MKQNSVLQYGYFLYILLPGILYWGSLMPLRAEASLAETEDFQAIGHLMEEKQLPLLLVFSAEHCAFCQRLETEYLQPMVQSGDYADRILIHTLQIDSNRPIRDFDGEEIDAGQLAARYQANLTPTLVFLNAKGEEVTERILGYSSPDFFGAYLENSIEAAQEAVRASVADPEPDGSEPSGFEQNGAPRPGDGGSPPTDP